MAAAKVALAFLGWDDWLSPAGTGVSPYYGGVDHGTISRRLDLSL